VWPNISYTYNISCANLSRVNRTENVTRNKTVEKNVTVTRADNSTENVTKNVTVPYDVEVKIWENYTECRIPHAVHGFNESSIERVVVGNSTHNRTVNRTVWKVHVRAWNGTQWIAVGDESYTNLTIGRDVFIFPIYTYYPVYRRAEYDGVFGRWYDRVTEPNNLTLDVDTGLYKFKVDGRIMLPGAYYKVCVIADPSAPGGGRQNDTRPLWSNGNYTNSTPADHHTTAEDVFVSSITGLNGGSIRVAPLNAQDDDAELEITCEDSGESFQANTTSVDGTTGEYLDVQSSKATLYSSGTFTNGTLQTGDTVNTGCSGSMEIFLAFRECSIRDRGDSKLQSGIVRVTPSSENGATSVGAYKFFVDTSDFRPGSAYRVCANFKMLRRTDATYYKGYDGTFQDPDDLGPYDYFGDTGVKVHISGLTFGGGSVLQDGTVQKMYIQQCLHCDGTGLAFLARGTCSTPATSQTSLMPVGIAVLKRFYFDVDSTGLFPGETLKVCLQANDNSNIPAAFNLDPRTNLPYEEDLGWETPFGIVGEVYVGFISMPLDPVTANDELGNPPTGQFDQPQMGSRLGMTTSEKFSSVTCVDSAANISIILSNETNGTACQEAVGYLSTSCTPSGPKEGDTGVFNLYLSGLRRQRDSSVRFRLDIRPRRALWRGWLAYDVDHLL
jgi:hypothetical protein